MHRNPLEDPNYLAAQGIIYDALDRVQASGNENHHARTLIAAGIQGEGKTLFHAGKHTESLRKYEVALNDLPNIPETASLRSLIYAQMLEPLMALRRYQDALDLRDQAITGLEADGRWSPCLAACCGNLGIAFAHSGNLVEGIQYVERSLALFEIIPNAAPQTKLTIQNLEIFREAQRQAQNRPWWKRLFGG